MNREAEAIRSNENVDSVLARFGWAAPASGSSRVMA